MPQAHKLTLVHITPSSLEEMNDNSMDDSATSIEHTLAEKLPPIDCDLDENSRKKTTDSARFENVTGTRKKLSLHRTPFYIFSFPIRSA